MKNENKKKKSKNIFVKEIIIHSLIMIILFIICVWDRKVNIPKFPKNFLFLTQISLYTNMSYYFLCIYKNIKEQRNTYKNSKLLLLYDFNFCVSFVVFVMYWNMLFFDKTTLYKKESKIMVPTLLNMLLHGGVFTTNLFELFVIKKSKKIPYISIKFYLCFTIFYIGILYFVKIFFGIKVYPFIYGNILKFFLISFTSFIATLIGHYIYIFITKRMNGKKADSNNYEEFDLK